VCDSPIGNGGPYHSGMSRVQPRVLIVLFVGVVAVSLSALLVRLAAAPALSTAALRLCFSAFPAVSLLIVRERHSVRRLDAAGWRWAVLSGLCLALHFATWIASLGMTTVSSSVALVTTSPLFVAAFELLRGTRVSRATLVATLVCLVGGLTIGYADLARGHTAVTGDVLALMGAAFAAAYFAIGRHLRASASLTIYVGIVYPIAAGCLVVIAVAARQPLTGFDAKTWVMLGLMALVPQLIGHSALNWALGYLSAPFVAIAVLGEPVIATMLAAAFLSELPGTARVAGGIVVLIGVYLGLRAEMKLVTPAARPVSADRGLGERLLEPAVPEVS